MYSTKVDDGKRETTRTLFLHALDMLEKDPHANFWPEIRELNDEQEYPLDLQESLRLRYSIEREQKELIGKRGGDTAVVEGANTEVVEPEQASKFQRVKVYRAIERGIPSLEFLVPGVLVKGKSHLLWGKSETGKSWIAKNNALTLVENETYVLYFDREMGEDTVGRRFEVLGADETLDEYLHYYPYIPLGLDTESRDWFEEQLATLPPGLVYYDSTAGFLSYAGLDENSNTDFEQWADFYLNMPRKYGWTTAALDHSPHDGDHARGASRKTNAVDVEWKVARKAPFDKDKVGAVRLERQKDRHSVVPSEIIITIGGTPFQFEMAFKGSDGRPYLTQTVYDALKVLFMCGTGGAKFTEWERQCCTTIGGKKLMGQTSFNNARNELVSLGYVAHGIPPLERTRSPYATLASPILSSSKSAGLM